MSGMWSPYYLLSIFLCLGTLSVGVSGQSYLRAEPGAVDCFGEKNGHIKFEFTGEKPAVYEIQIADSLHRLIFTLNDKTDSGLIAENLSAGKYFVQLTGPSIIETQTVTIEGPDKLLLEMIKIVELKGNASSVRVSLEAFPSGGTLPYTYQWSENTGNQKNRMAENLLPGIYNCKVSDANRCETVEATFYLFEDEINKFNQENNTKE
jgi:hypothetical protein